MQTLSLKQGLISVLPCSMVVPAEPPAIVILVNVIAAQTGSR